MEIVLWISGLWIDYLLEIVEIGVGEIFDDGLCKVIVYLLEHLLECYGYCIEEYDKLGVLNV